MFLKQQTHQIVEQQRQEDIEKRIMSRTMVPRTRWEQFHDAQSVHKCHFENRAIGELVGTTASVKEKVY